MPFMFESDYNFLLKNRQKLVVKSRDIAKKLKKSDQKEYDPFCKQITFINECSNKTDQFSKYVSELSKRALSSVDWIELNWAISDEMKGSKMRERKKVQDHLNVMFGVDVGLTLFSCLASTAVIALGVFIAPGFFVLLAFTLAPLGAVFMRKPESNLLNQVAQDNFEQDFVTGLAFDSRVLEDEFALSSDSCDNLKP